MQVASPKGLYSHYLNHEPQAITSFLPVLPNVDLDWILVVEKEATFTVLADGLLRASRAVGRGMCVTVSDLSF